MDSDLIPLASPLSPKNENVVQNDRRIKELKESRTELLSRIQGFKQDLQSWRSILDTQVSTYRHELADLKQSLDVEMEQLRTGFQELRTTLQQQQEDVTTKLNNIGLQDETEDVKEAPVPEGGDDEERHILVHEEEKAEELAISVPGAENAEEPELPDVERSVKEETQPENGKEVKM